MVNVVRQISKAQFCFGSDPADRSDQVIHGKPGLDAEDVLNSCANFRMAPISKLARLAQRTIAVAFFVDAPAEAAFGKCRL